MSKYLIALSFIFIASPFLKAQSVNDKIVGVWYTEDNRSKVEVFKKGNEYYGKVIWLIEDTNADGSSPKIDVENPDEKLQKRKIVGSVILTGLKWDSDEGEWNDGEIYDPKTGSTYSCYAILQEDGKLFFKGYIGFSLIGKSTLWTRTK